MKGKRKTKQFKKQTKVDNKYKTEANELTILREGKYAKKVKGKGRKFLSNE